MEREEGSILVREEDIIVEIVGFSKIFIEKKAIQNLDWMELISLSREEKAIG